VFVYTCAKHAIK